MNAFEKKFALVPALLAWAALLALAHGQATARLTSAFLARGEQAYLEIAISGAQPESLPIVPEVRGVTIQQLGNRPSTEMVPGRRLEYVFRYVVTSYETGKHTIPPARVRVAGAEARTAPIELEIFDPAQLQWFEAKSMGRTFRYASAFRIHNPKPFEHETSPLEIKVYVPDDLLVEDWGIPDFERDGVTAWRLQPSARLSQINLLGQPYRSVAYPGTVTPTRVGQVSIGPAKIRLTTLVTLSNPYPHRANEDVNIQVPRLEIDSRPLPEGAPAGYENAVGQFQLSASSGVTEVQEGDPLTVDLIVSGSGNLDTLGTPNLANPAGWKIYGTTTEQRGDERRLLTGSVTFHQSIRPTELKSEIPAYRFAYFDPLKQEYVTLLTEPIPLKITPSTAPNRAAGEIVQSLSIPFERMTDILGLLHPSRLTRPSGMTPPPWLVHAIGGLLALALICKALWMHYAPRFRKDPGEIARLRALREVEDAKSTGDTEFLKRAGAFIERWLGTRDNPELAAVLAERDAVCFRQQPPAEILDRRRRSEILRLLRRSATALAFLATLAVSAPSARAAAENPGEVATKAYETARYEEAAKLWLQAGKFEDLSADTLYNIGNACYRGGAPGYAALYYRRALSRDSSHQESRQNLRFIERKFGAITVQRPDFQYSLARFSLTAWKTVCWGAVWLCLLSLLVFPATRATSRLRVAAVTALVIAPVVASAAFLGWHYFPNDAEFAPVARQAVIVADGAVLHTDAARTSPEVIDAPPGSLCEIVRESGRWAYVAFATKTRGWVPISAIEKVRPETPPDPPKFRKARSDGKSA